MSVEPLYYIYCDESRQTKDKFMVLGGIIINSKKLDDSKIITKEFRKNSNMKAELKWSKVSNYKLDEYKKFIDIFFNALENNVMRFHSVILDRHQIDNSKYNNGNKEVGFYKFFYQLLLHGFGKKYCNADEATRLIVYMDYRNTKYPLKNLKDYLNVGMANKFWVLNSPFRNIEPLDSKSSDVMQLNDILIGAIGYEKNGYHLKPNASEAKKALCIYIAEKAGLKVLFNTTPRTHYKFSIWNFRLRKK